MWRDKPQEALPPGLPDTAKDPHREFVRHMRLTICGLAYDVGILPIACAWPGPLSLATLLGKASFSDDATAQSASSHEPSVHPQYSNQPPLVLRFGGPPESV